MSLSLGPFIVRIPNFQQVLDTVVDATDAIFPDIQVDNTSSRSGKRKRSGGDSKGGVSAKTSRRMEKNPCKFCGKFIRGRTWHPPTACDREQIRTGKKENITNSPPFCN